VFACQGLASPIHFPPPVRRPTEGQRSSIPKRLRSLIGVTQSSCPRRRLPVPRVQGLRHAAERFAASHWLDRCHRIVKDLRLLPFAGGKGNSRKGG